MDDFNFSGFIDDIGTFFTQTIPQFASDFMSGVEDLFKGSGFDGMTADSGSNSSDGTKLYGDSPNADITGEGSLASLIGGASRIGVSSQADAARVGADDNGSIFQDIMKGVNAFAGWTKDNKELASMLGAGISKGIDYYLTKDTREAQLRNQTMAAQASMMNAQTNQQYVQNKIDQQNSAAGVHVGIIDQPYVNLRKKNPPDYTANNVIGGVA